MNLTDKPTIPEENRVQAAEIYAMARKLESQQDYNGAMKCYKHSLRLHEDEEVKAAYFNFLATIGPE